MNELQELVDSLAGETGRLVGLDDTRFGAIAYSAHPDNVDKVRRDSILNREAPAEVVSWLEGLGIRVASGPMRVPANSRFGMSARVCVPVRHQDVLLGFLWAIDEPDPMPPAEIDAAEECATELASILQRLRMHAGQQRTAERRLLASLTGVFADDVDLGEPVDEDLLARTEEYVVVVARVPANAREEARNRTLDLLEEAFDRSRRRFSPRHFLTSFDAHQVLAVIAVDSRDEFHARVEELAGQIEEKCDAARLRRPPVGVGGFRSSPDSLGESYEEAELAIRVVLAVAEMGPVAHWLDLGAYATVAKLLGSADPGPLLPAGIVRLVEADESGVLTATLETYLDHAGDAAATAATIPLHRSSLYHRLHRIEEIAEVDLRSGEDRLTLHLGLRLMHLMDGGADADG